MSRLETENSPAVVAFGAGPTAFFADAHGTEPVRAEIFGLDRLEIHARHLAAHTRSDRFVAGRPLLQQFVLNRRSLLTPIARLARLTAVKRHLARTPNGCSTIFTSCPKHCSRSTPICRRAITSCCPKSRPAPCEGCRAFTRWPSNWWPTATAASTRPTCPIRQRFPDRRAFDNRRTVGHPDHVAFGPGG